MVIRPFWIRRVQQAWQRKSLIWLSGVRRVGKTTLCKMLPDTVYLNCDLPSVQRQLEDPELFYNGLSEQATVIFDEVHRLLDPSLILKIGTDAYPHIKILATGSSTLAASKKFRDSLTGRKIQIHLPPIIWPECTDTFQINQLEKRLVFGGLPEMLLADENDPTFYSEWIDSFYARDIQELFGIRCWLIWKQWKFPTYCSVCRRFMGADVAKLRAVQNATLLTRDLLLLSTVGTLCASMSAEFCGNIWYLTFYAFTIQRNAFSIGGTNPNGKLILCYGAAQTQWMPSKLK